MFEIVRLPFRRIAEQTAIAAFLDRETAKIDALVAEQRRLIELLKEKRQAVISHAVTKGLEPPRPHEALRHRMARRRAGALGGSALKQLAHRIDSRHCGTLRPTHDV